MSLSEKCFFIMLICFLFTSLSCSFVFLSTGTWVKARTNDNQYVLCVAEGFKLTSTRKTFAVYVYMFARGSQ